MKAVRFHAFGDADVLRYEDVEQPDPGAGEVRDPGRRDVVQPGRRRHPRRLPAGPVPCDAAAHPRHRRRRHRRRARRRRRTASQVGDDGRRVPADDAPTARPPSTSSRRPRSWRRRPTSIPLADAAALPMVGLTAWQALFDDAELTAGQRVLINGAGGAVGGYAVQLAKRGRRPRDRHRQPAQQRARQDGGRRRGHRPHHHRRGRGGEPSRSTSCSTSRRSPPRSSSRWSPWSARAASSSTRCRRSPHPTDEERGVRAIGVFVRSDADQLSRARRAGRPRRTTRRRRRARAAGRVAGDPCQGGQWHAPRQSHRPTRRRPQPS